MVCIKISCFPLAYGRSLIVVPSSHQVKRHLEQETKEIGSHLTSMRRLPLCSVNTSIWLVQLGKVPTLDWVVFRRRWPPTGYGLDLSSRLFTAESVPVRIRKISAVGM